MLLNLPMTRTPLNTAVELQYADGILAHLDKVAQQYIEGHALQPLRLMLTGPPAAGKSSVAARQGFMRHRVDHLVDVQLA